MPCFNAAPWIRAAISSVLHQGFYDLELIVINDGSTDSSAYILNRISANDARVCVIDLEGNGGIVNALNIGLDRARGAFIARIDADDLAMEGRFARQLDFLQKTGVDLCGSWFVEFGAGIPRTVRWPHSEGALRAAILFQNPICHPTVLARREVFERFRYRESFLLAEDFDLFVRASQVFRIANTPEVLLRYRRHPLQATAARRDAMEAVTRRIRSNSLKLRGIATSAEEERLHNLIRAPASIREESDLEGIEAWLRRLYSSFLDEDARAVVASQWLRACVRAAPLGMRMWRLFRASPFYSEVGTRLATQLDLRALAILKLDYQSRTYDRLRRFGLSA